MNDTAEPRPVSTDILLLVGLAFAKLFIHFYANGGYGYFRDELYFLACGQRLAWGYVDQPPLVAVVARVSRFLLGDSLFAIRFFPAVAGALKILFAGLLARELGGRRFAQVLAAVAVLVSPMLLGTDNFLSMNSFDQLIWLLAAYLLAVILKRENSRLWPLFGLVAGLGLLNKYSMFVFGGGLVIALALTSARKEFRNPWLYLGGAIALALALPNLFWQYQHGWPQFELLRNADLYKNFHISPIQFLLGHLLENNPLNIVLWIAGFVFYFRMPAGKTFRALGWIYLFSLAAFVLTRGRPYYLAPAFPFLLAAGAVAWEHVTQRPGRVWLQTATVAALLVTGILLAPFALPILPEERFIRYAQAFSLKPPPVERHEMGPLPQFYADMHGWPEMVAEVGRVYNDLSPFVRGRAAIYCENYGEAGAIDFFGPIYSLPKAISGHNNYWIWGPGKFTGEIVITVGVSREFLEQGFDEITEAGKVSHPFAMPYENRHPIYLCRKPKASLKEFWPKVKHYN